MTGAMPLSGMKTHTSGHFSKGEQKHHEKTNLEPVHGPGAVPGAAAVHDCAGQRSRIANHCRRRDFDRQRRKPGLSHNKHGGYGHHRRRK